MRCVNARSLKSRDYVIFFKGGRTLSKKMEILMNSNCVFSRVVLNFFEISFVLFGSRNTSKMWEALLSKSWKVLLRWVVSEESEAQVDFYFVDRASRYKFLVITNLTHFFMYLFISCLYTLRASQRSSSGDRILLIHHMVWLVCVNDCLVCRSGIPSSHLYRLIIPFFFFFKYIYCMLHY